MKTRQELDDAWQKCELSPWNAVVYILHSVNHENVDEWMDKLPDAIYEAVVDAVQHRVGELIAIGGGKGFPEHPEAKDAIRSWLRKNDPNKLNAHE